MNRGVIAAFYVKSIGLVVCRVCIRQYSKNTQQPALQEGNESTDRRVRTLSADRRKAKRAIDRGRPAGGADVSVACIRIF